MSFSLFTFLFLVSVTILYYILRRGMRPYVLLAASLFYVWYLQPRALKVLLVTTLFVYLSGLLIAYDKEKGRSARAKAVMFFSVGCCILALVLFKMPYFILTVGFSYYIFQAVAYLVEVWRGTIPVEKNPAHFALYLCYFPKFISGPIEDPTSFLKQIGHLADVPVWEERRLSMALTELLYGYFLKLVIADRLAKVTAAVFGAYHATGWIWLAAGSLCYTLQLYADFAGYSALAVGISRLYGIRLIQNFEAPYLSPGITEFWRRWHRSLSAWLKKYVYIPLGGNRKGTSRKCVNTLIVFLLCGIWHGNGLNFVAWGLLHGLYSVTETLARKKEKAVSASWHVTGRVLTFLGVSFAWIFFGSSSLSGALRYILRIVTLAKGTGSFHAERIALGISGVDLVIVFFALLAAVFFDVVIYRAKKPFAEAVQEWKYGWRYLLFYLLIVTIFVFGVYGGGYDTAAFMYMDF